MLTWVWECNKDCENGEYLKSCECMKSLVDDLVDKCDGIENTPNDALIDPSDRINYWLVPIVLLSIMCLVLVAVIVVKVCMKSGFMLIIILV